MYSVAQVGVGWVDVRYRCPSDFSTTACKVRKKSPRDVWFRVGEPVCWSCLQQVECVRGRRKTQLDCWVRGSSSKDFSGRSFSVSPRAQVPGDLSLVSETLRDVRDVREGTLEEAILKKGFIEGSGGGDDVIALGYGWKVREASRFDTEELRAVAHVQACSFHLQAAVFDDLFFKLFKAEVLSALIYKARHSPADSAASVDNEVLRHLHSATEYLYVSGMAVDINYRRRNIATMLLRGCELLAMKWGFDYLVLHAYEDDTAARTLYDRGGYRVIALDPLWISTWVGRKRRVLMAKRTSRTPNFDF